MVSQQNVSVFTCADPERDSKSAPPPPPINHKNIGFPNNTGPDPHKNHKATKLASNVWPSSARR